MVRRFMDGPGYLACTAPEVLDDVSGMIHDRWLSISAVELDEPAGLLTLPFLFHPWRSRESLDTRLAVLRVHGASDLVVSDPERIEVYSLNDVSFNSGKAPSTFTVRAEPNLEVHVDVDRLDIEIEVFGTLGPLRRVGRGVLRSRSESSPDMTGIAWLR